MATTEVNKPPHWAPTAGMLLVKIGKAAERRFEKALKPSGLTPRHLGVLFEVDARPTSQQAIGAAIRSEECAASPASSRSVANSSSVGGSTPSSAANFSIH